MLNVATLPLRAETVAPFFLVSADGDIIIPFWSRGDFERLSSWRYFWKSDAVLTLFSLSNGANLLRWYLQHWKSTPITWHRGVRPSAISELAKTNLWRPPMAVPCVWTQGPRPPPFSRHLIPIPPTTSSGACLSGSQTRAGSEHHWFYHGKISQCETQTDRSLKTKLVPSSLFETGKLLFIPYDRIQGIAKLATPSQASRPLQWGGFCMRSRHWQGLKAHVLSRAGAGQCGGCK